MEIIKDILNNKETIVNSIHQHGYAPEHNFWHFFNLQTEKSKCWFLRFNGNAGIMSLLNKSGSCEMISEVLASKNKRMEVFEEFLNHMLRKLGLKKVYVFVGTDFKNEIKKMADKNRNHNRYSLSRSRTYYCPIFNLKNFDERLPGKFWKKIRNIKNKFYRDHDVQVVQSQDVDRKALLDIVLQWKKRKGSHDRAEYVKYLNFIKNDFRGAKYARTLVVNGKPSTITAGWSIPDSNIYHSAIGIHNYMFEDLSYISNLDDLLFLKKMGHVYANFGSSDKDLLAFKKKFNPESIVKLHYFSIRKSNQ